MLAELKQMVSRHLPEFIKRARGHKVFADRPAGLRMRDFGNLLIAFRGHTADEEVLRETFQEDLLFSRVHAYRPSTADTIVDIGAHIGAFALRAAQRVPNGKVFAVEPSEDSFNFLTLNCALNRVSNVFPHHLAIMDKSSVVTLYHDSGNWGHSVVDRLSDRSESVQACSLAEFFDQCEIHCCDFVKFNCEGAEFPIILFASPAALAKCRNMLILYHTDLWRKNSAADLVTHLTHSGFTCELHAETKFRGWIVATRPSDVE